MLNYSISPADYLANITRHRHLIRQLVVREFVGKYRGSMLGVVWAVVTPLVMVAVFVFVFGVVFQSRWGGESTPKATFTVTFLTGMMVHSLFAEALGRAPTAILGNVSYVRKVVFPLEILPIVIVANALVTALIGLAIVVVIHAVTSGSLEATLLLLPLILAPFVLLVLGLVYFVSAVGVYFRDLLQIIGLVTLASLFLSPIFYPLSAVPEPYRILLYLNPLTFAVEQTRKVTLYGQPPDWAGLVVYTTAAIALAWLGYAWFQKTRKGFADVI